MTLFTFKMPRFLAAGLCCAVIATTAGAQTTAPQNATGKAVPVPYQSAFEGYRSYADEPVANWKAANDTAARIGGWREYARQAQQPDNTPAAATKPGDTMPGAKP